MADPTENISAQQANTAQASPRNVSKSLTSNIKLYHIGLVSSDIPRQAWNTKNELVADLKNTVPEIWIREFEYITGFACGMPNGARFSFSGDEGRYAGRIVVDEADVSSDGRRGPKRISGKHAADNGNFV